MTITAAALIGQEHADHLASALPGRFTARLVEIGDDRGVRISQQDDGKITGFWEVVPLSSAATWVWWMPGQDIRVGAASGTLMESLGAPLHFPEEWARRVAEAIDTAKSNRDRHWTMPI